MSIKTQAAKNVGSGWLSLLVHLAVGFFLSPFILHKLGDDAFGLWVLILSLTGYYGLLDFGIRSSIVRYVARFNATRDEDQLARFFNTTMATYTIVAVLVLLITGVGCFYLDVLFRIPPQFLRTARLLFLIMGAEFALSFPLSVFPGVLQGLQKFSWQNLTQIAYTLARGLAIVIGLERGGGLLTLAAIVVATDVLGHGVFVWMMYRIRPLPLSLRFVDRKTFRQMLAYSSAAFLILVAEKLRFQSDAVVIGIFLSPAAITYFSIGLKLAEYPTNILQSLAEIFTPISSHLDATGDLGRLRKLFLDGNRACAMTIFPLSAILIVLGKSIIEVWVGAKYLSSYSILLLLIIPKTLYLAQATSTKVLLGMGRHQTLAWVLLGEGGANLILSVVLLRHWGIVGVALGTAIPLACTSLFFLPRHLCRLLEIPLGTFLGRAYRLPLALSAPLLVVLVFVKQLFHAHGYGGLFLQVASGGIVYSLGLLWWFLTREPSGVELRARFAQIRCHAKAFPDR